MINIALDGPSGAGKSTIAKAIASKLGYVYVDTGALYRSIGLYIYRKNKNPKSADDVVPELPNIKLELKYQDSVQHVFLNGEDVSELIRQDHISMYASDVSAIPAVREFLLDTQRSIAKENNTIMDGRDIGTVILPNAQVKVFLTATDEVRANRRYNQLLEKNMPCNYEDILKDIKLRDSNDKNRTTAPAIPADDAIIFDNSDMTLEESVAFIIDIIEKKTNK